MERSVKILCCVIVGLASTACGRSVPQTGHGPQLSRNERSAIVVPSPTDFDGIAGGFGDGFGTSDFGFGSGFPATAYDDLAAGLPQPGFGFGGISLPADFGAAFPPRNHLFSGYVAPTARRPAFAGTPGAGSYSFSAPVQFGAAPTSPAVVSYAPNTPVDHGQSAPATSPAVNGPTAYRQATSYDNDGINTTPSPPSGGFRAGSVPDLVLELRPPLPFAATEYAANANSPVANIAAVAPAAPTFDPNPVAGNAPPGAPGKPFEYSSAVSRPDGTGNDAQNANANTVQTYDTTATAQYRQPTQAYDTTAPAQYRQLTQAYDTTAPAQNRQPVQAYDTTAPVQNRQPVQAYDTTAPAQNRQPVQTYDTAATAQYRQQVQAYDTTATAQYRQPVQAYDTAAAGPYRQPVHQSYDQGQSGASGSTPGAYGGNAPTSTGTAGQQSSYSNAAADFGPAAASRPVPGNAPNAPVPYADAQKPILPGKPFDYSSAPSAFSRPGNDIAQNFYDPAASAPGGPGASAQTYVQSGADAGATGPFPAARGPVPSGGQNPPSNSPYSGNANAAVQNSFNELAGYLATAVNGKFGGDYFNDSNSVSSNDKRESSHARQMRSDKTT